MRVVFDSLSEMRLLARDPLRYRRQILALKQFFVGRQCTVLLLDDHTSADSDRQLESLAHGVILLEHTAPGYGSPQRQLRVVKLRGVKYLGGYHDFVILTGGTEVYPRLVAKDRHKSFAQHSILSEVEGLDTLMGGGLDVGTSTLIMGPAGAGKSTLAAAYAWATANRGQKIAYYTFDENLSTFLTRTAALGMDFEGFIKAGTAFIRQIDPAELSPGEFSNLVRNAVEQREATLIVIDSINGYYQSMPEARFLNAYLHELLAYLAQQGVTTILVMAQYGLLGNSMTTPVDVSYLADTVLLLRYFEAAGEIRQAISVIKKRSGSHERTIREFHLDSNGIQVGEPLKDFRGVLSGQPEYYGSTEPLIKGENGTGKS
jgi:circadian clock protein KaiC